MRCLRRSKYLQRGSKNTTVKFGLGAIHYGGPNTMWQIRDTQYLSKSLKLKAYLSTQPSSLSASMISKACKVAQKPCQRQLPTTKLAKKQSTGDDTSWFGSPWQLTSDPWCLNCERPWVLTQSNTVVVLSKCRMSPLYYMVVILPYQVWCHWNESNFDAYVHYHLLRKILFLTSHLTISV